MAFNVQHHFRLTFRGGEEVVRLKTFDAGKSEHWICLCQRNNIIRDRIDPKLALEKVLHHVLVTHFGDIRDAVDRIGEIRVIFEGKPISRLRHAHSRYVGLIDIGILIVNVERL